MRHRKSKKAGKVFLESREKSHGSELRPYCGFFPTCSAGHVTIEVGELSDSQEKDESKKSSGPGQFLLLKETVSLDLKGKEFQPSIWEFFYLFIYFIETLFTYFINTWV